MSFSLITGELLFTLVQVHHLSNVQRNWRIIRLNGNKVSNTHLPTFDNCDRKKHECTTGWRRSV